MGARGGGSVLLVDDSVVSRQQIRGKLEADALTVVEASEGAEALWRARLTTFDVVLTDFHMPTMDGLSFVRELRTLPGYASTPVFVLSSDSSKERMQQGRQAGQRHGS
jgi:two-component system chemotaxis response regulator CheY